MAFRTWRAPGFDTAREFFSPLTGKEIYHTLGFRRLALFHGSTDLPYRRNQSQLNEVRHQPDATKLRTLANAAQSEAAELEAALEATVAQLLDSPRHDPLGRPLVALPPQPPPDAFQKAEAVQTAIAAVLQDPSAHGIAAAELAANPVPYQAPGSHVEISPDDICVKRQKAHRRRPKTAAEAKKRAWTTLVHVEHANRRYTLVSNGIAKGLRQTEALLQASGLQDVPLVVYLDGQRQLQIAVQDFWSMRGQVQMILDYYHLQKKCRELGSLGLQGSIAEKAVHIGELKRLLWYGLIDRAIAYLHAIPPAAVRRPDALTQIEGYLERNRGQIPCYAVRRHLGLRCSSNRVEKENDLVVAQRQKKNGMSWSDDGSHALALLTAQRRNGEVNRWLTHRTLAFSLAA